MRVCNSMEETCRAIPTRCVCGDYHQTDYHLLHIVIDFLLFSRQIYIKVTIHSDTFLEVTSQFSLFLCLLAFSLSRAIFI